MAEILKPKFSIKQSVYFICHTDKCPICNKKYSIHSRYYLPSIFTIERILWDGKNFSYNFCEDPYIQDEGQPEWDEAEIFETEKLCLEICEKMNRSEEI